MMLSCRNVVQFEVKDSELDVGDSSCHHRAREIRLMDHLLEVLHINVQSEMNSPDSVMHLLQCVEHPVQLYLRLGIL